jgi:heme/copper-type cytochrome/quinol oxidase subunit 3
MRSALGLVASALAGLAAVIASLDRDADIVPFFVGLTFAGGVAAWAAHPPFEGSRRRVAQGVALIWLVAAVWVGVLLVMYVTVWQGGATPPPTPEQAYLGLPATAYHLVGLYVGAVLVLLLAFGRQSWFGGSISAATAAPAQP